MNIKKTLINQYQIDIDQVNLPKLYKIESADLSASELEAKFAACRKRWTQSANGTNERLAARDKAHLEKAGTYESILRNKNYLQALIAYHSGGGANEAACEFAKNFFTTLKEVNSSISQKDFNFFMQYFREERKNEKAILEMLKKDFKAVALKPCSFEDEEEQDTKAKASLPGMEQTRFHRDSLSLLHKCELQYEALQKSQFLLEKYPSLNQPFYEFLRLDEFEETDFAMYIDSAVQEVFTRRQNDAARGSEYIPLSEYYNTWKDLLGRNDVVSNFHAFKKLVLFPKFTPYLYLAEDVNAKFLEQLLKELRDVYNFVNLGDFLFLYFKPLAEGRHYSFTLDKKLEAMLKRVEKHPDDAARESKRSDAAAKRRKMIPVSLHILRLLATWPVCLAQLIFETFRFLVINVRKRAWMVGVLFAMAFPHMLGGISLYEGLWEGITGFHGQVTSLVSQTLNTTSFSNFAYICGCLTVLVEYAAVLALVPTLVALFLHTLAKKLDQAIDLTGCHKTFGNIQQMIEQKLIYSYKKTGKRAYTQLIWPIAANILTVTALGLLIWFALSSVGFLGAEAVLTACC